MTFKQDTQETPVLFRVSRTPTKHGTGVTAVFPTIPSDYNGYNMSCFELIGGHSGCGQEWINATRPATPEEYTEIKQVLESYPYGYRLKIYRRTAPGMREKRMQDARKIRNVA